MLFVFHCSTMIKCCVLAHGAIGDASFEASSPANGYSGGATGRGVYTWNVTSAIKKLSLAWRSAFVTSP